MSHGIVDYLFQGHDVNLAAFCTLTHCFFYLTSSSWHLKLLAEALSLPCFKQGLKLSLESMKLSAV